MAVEEGRKGGIWGRIFWILWGEKHSGRSFFLRKNESDGAEREDSWRRGLTPGGRFTLREREVAIQFISTWARGIVNPSVS